MNENRYHHMEPCDACAMMRQRVERAESRVAALTEALREARDAMCRSMTAQLDDFRREITLADAALEREEKK